MVPGYPALVNTSSSSISRLRAYFRSDERTLNLTKWVLFGVAVPLLPIVSRMLAEWMDLGHADLRIEHLYGDGELLVLATVIAAAGIGDLIFDLQTTRRNRVYRDSAAIAFALVCVILSVLLYGLVTLKREQLTPGQQAVSSSVEAQSQQVNILRQRSDQLHRQVVEAAAQYSAASAAATAEFNGTGGTHVPGVGAEYQRLAKVASDLATRLHQLQQETAAADASLVAAQMLLTRSQFAQVTALASPVQHPYDGFRGAEASLWMFWLSVAAGLNCVLANSLRTARPHVVAAASIPQADGLSG